MVAGHLARAESRRASGRSGGPMSTRPSPAGRGGLMSKALRWALLISAIAVVGAALVIAFMLSLTSERDLFERNFVWLFWVNLAVAAALLLVIAIAAARLAVRLRSGK